MAGWVCKHGKRCEPLTFHEPEMDGDAYRQRVTQIVCTECLVETFMVTMDEQTHSFARRTSEGA
jgi:hypothetical protein